MTIYHHNKGLMSNVWIFDSVYPGNTVSEMWYREAVPASKALADAKAKGVIKPIVSPKQDNEDYMRALRNQDNAIARRIKASEVNKPAH